MTADPDHPDDARDREPWTWPERDENSGHVRGDATQAGGGECDGASDRPAGPSPRSGGRDVQQTTPGAGGGGQPQQRELVYRVRVVADTQQANQAFAQMSRQAQGAASHYPQPGGAMGGGGMVYQPGGGWVPGQPPSGSGGGGGGNAAGSGQDKNVGIAAGYAVLMSRLTVAVGFATTAMEKFKSVVEAVNTQGRETVNAAPAPGSSTPGAGVAR